MKLQYVSRKHVTHVELQKDGKSSVGIDVKAGTECEQQRPTIKSIKNKSLAQRSQCVSEGDVILSVCGQDSRGMSRKYVKQLMKEAKSRIDLKLQYEIAEPCLNSFRINRLQRMALKLCKEQDSFGFTLRKNGLDHNVCSEYPIVSNIRQGGPADKAGSLKAGDHLVQIDDQSLSYLSLMDVSNILKAKEEATFLFQYNIAIADSYIRPGERNDLEIDCPGTDLGVTLTSSIENSSEIFIKEIQRGSLAERCGALQVGDVLVRINDIDTVFLTASKANSLLQGFKKNPGKIVFIPKTKRSPLGRVPEKNPLKDQTPSPCRSFADDQLIPLSSQPKLHNSPESLYQTFHAKRASPTPKCHYHVYDLQIKTVSMLRDVIKNISNLKHFIPFLDCNENHNSFGDPSDKEGSSSKDNLIQFHPSRVSQLTAAYVRTKDSAYAATMHIIKNAMTFMSLDADDSHNSSNVSCRGDGNKCHVRSNLLQGLTENLTEIYTKKFMSKYSFDRLVENLNEIDMDCWECSDLCVLAAMTTQNVMLLLSLHDSNPNVWPVIKKLMDGIIKLKIPCEDCQKSWCSISHLDPLVSSNGSNTYFNHLQNQSLVTGERICSSRQSGCIVEDVPKQFHQPKTKSPEVGLNIAEETAAYSSSTPFHSESNISCDDNPSTYFHFQRFPTDTPATSPSDFDSKQVNEHSVETENGGQAENYNTSSRDKFQKGKEFPPAPKHNWKSAEVISDSRNSPSVIPKHASVPTNIDEKCQLVANSFVSRQSPLGVSSSSSSGGVLVKQGCIVHPGNPSTSKDHSFSSEPKTLVTTIDVPTKPSTLEVKLKGGGRGYGIDIGFESHGSELPVVKAMIPQSAADKMGVLVVGDRVLEINGQSTVGLTPTELECLTLEAFHSNEMQLLTEFDVKLHEVKYGTFDIFVDSSAKAGLVFVDFRQETPLVVKGVVKGSAAHRCGQLFAGDEILYTNCLREEVYNSYKNTFRKKNTFIITIRRTLTDENFEVSQECKVHPRHSPSLTDSGKMYEVKRVSTRAENETMILEHEVTLFRDPTQKDFGFLVSTNLKSGRVYVDFIRPEGPADMCKVIKKNDRILEVNGKAILVSDENSILSTFLQMEDRMDLITRRILRCQ